MQNEIEELAELIAPRLFGKPLRDLDFMQSFRGVEKSERHRCIVEACKVRYEALARLNQATGRGYTDCCWPELLTYCEAIINERGLLREPGEEG